MSRTEVLVSLTIQETMSHRENSDVMGSRLQNKINEVMRKEPGLAPFQIRLGLDFVPTELDQSFYANPRCFHNNAEIRVILIPDLRGFEIDFYQLPIGRHTVGQSERWTKPETWVNEEGIQITVRRCHMTDQIAYKAKSKPENPWDFMSAMELLAWGFSRYYEEPPF